MRALHETDRKFMLMIIAEDVELIGVVVKKIEGDVGEVVFSGLLGSDSVEYT